MKKVPPSAVPSVPTMQTYGELQRAYAHFNTELFGGQLPECLITLQREKQTYGYFSSKRFVHRDGVTTVDEIAINPSYFAVVPMMEVLQTIVHEMVHAWQHHFGDPGRRSYHNQEWADKMEEVGLTPSHTGQPGGKRTGEKMADYPAPGGKFLEVADALITKDFTLSWLDRFPPQPPSSGGGMRSPSQPRPAGSPELAPMALPEGVEMPPEAMHNRSNRVKVRCPECGSQAWGKPAIKLLCGEEECMAAPLEVVDD